MSKDRSHLVPTQIVDKNGVSTTRHVKPSGSSALAQSAIPPVALKSVIATANTDLSRLTEAVFGHGYSKLDAKIMEKIHEDDSKTLPLAISLISNGSPDARESVLETLRGEIDDILALHGHAAYGKIWERWSRQEYDPWSQRLHHKMISIWTAVGVLEETGRDVTPDSLDEGMDVLDGLLHPLSTNGDRSDGPVYWRGLAAAVLSNVAFDEAHRRDAYEFPVWAGNHEDIARAINVAEERRTFNVATLTEILEHQDQSPKPIREGTL